MRLLFLPLVALALFACPAMLDACPFCAATEPTWAERREAADVVLLCEVIRTQNNLATVVIRSRLKGPERYAVGHELSCSSSSPAGSLLILVGSISTEPQSVRWESWPVDEVGYAYFVRSPNLRQSAAERLAYFVRFLEHREGAIADDAYAEFGRAPYDAVEAVADKLPMADIRRWIVDPDIPQLRKGFYGLALGLARHEDDRQANRTLLRMLVTAPANDYRSGFDGVLGGLLVLEGEAGLQLLDEHILARRDSARGDVLHAVTALRFYYEFGRQIDKARLARSMSLLLERVDTIATAIVDLARWEAWAYLPRVITLARQSPPLDAQADRAIAGYLTRCPLDEARAVWSQLKLASPRRWQQAESSLTPLNVGR